MFSCLICVHFIRLQDNLTKTSFVSIAVVRWLHFRMDCITSLFLTAVTAIAVMTSQHAGEEMIINILVRRTGFSTRKRNEQIAMIRGSINLIVIWKIAGTSCRVIFGVIARKT